MLFLLTMPISCTDELKIFFSYSSCTRILSTVRLIFYEVLVVILVFPGNINGCRWHVFRFVAPWISWVVAFERLCQVNSRHREYALIVPINFLFVFRWAWRAQAVRQRIISIVTVIPQVKHASCSAQFAWAVIEVRCSRKSIVITGSLQVVL